MNVKQDIKFQKQNDSGSRLAVSFLGGKCFFVEFVTPQKPLKPVWGWSLPWSILQGKFRALSLSFEHLKLWLKARKPAHTHISIYCALKQSVSLLCVTQTGIFCTSFYTVRGTECWSWPLPWISSLISVLQPTKWKSPAFKDQESPRR